MLNYDVQLMKMTRLLESKKLITTMCHYRSNCGDMVFQSGGRNSKFKRFNAQHLKSFKSAHTQ